MTGSQGEDATASVKIGRYAVTRELGRGGMGIVYEATDPAIGRRVAIKVINLQFMTGDGEAQLLRERLFREARSAGALSHPGIVLVYDVGEDRERAFIAMEYVDGPSLQQVQQSGAKLQTAEVVEILRQVAAALDYAHRNGVVHRDIKPPNIMLHQGNQVKIADFGIAKITSAPKYTVTGLVMGTPAYMSPEQIEGREVDGRSDQFSLAVVAYELLTGTVPFQGGTYASVVHGIVYGERPSAVAANPLLPAAFDQVLGRGMAARPEDRFANCTEFVAALSFAETAPAQKAPPLRELSPAPQTRPTRRLMPVVASVLFLVALGGAAAYKFWPLLRSGTAPQTQTARPSVATANLPPPPSVPPEDKQKPGDLPAAAAQADPPPAVVTSKETAKPAKKKAPVVAAESQTPANPVESHQPPTTQSVVVRSDQAWTATGILLQASDTAGIVASGTIQVAADKRLARQQPGGFYPNCGRAKELFGQPVGAVPAPNLNCWSLIGRVGRQGAIFEIGVQGAVPAGLAGRLFLGVNDDDYADNAGSWSAVVTVEHH